MPDLRKLIISWNNRFPLDREYRKKYNIPFNSPQHRIISQLDIYLEWLEEEAFKAAIENAVEDIEKKEQFDKGVWLKPREAIMSSEEDIDAFDKLDVGVLNKEE